MTVEAVTLPFAGFEDDVAELRRVMDEAASDAIVCGHSYGGRVMAAAAVGNPRVKHLVYLAAFMLSAKQLGEFKRKWQGSWAQGRIGSGAFDLDTVRRKFFSDCSETAVRRAFSHLRPMVEFGPLEGLDFRPWEQIPSTYIVCRFDQALNPEWQDEMAANATFRVDLDSGHSPFLSQPEVLSEILESIARNRTPRIVGSAADRSSP